MRGHACSIVDLAPPPVPVITAVSFTTGTSFTIEWSEPPGSCEMVDGFDPQLSPNDLSCMMSGMTYTCFYSRAHLGQTYTFIVSALNCDTQRGEEASVSVNLQGMSPHSVLCFDKDRNCFAVITGSSPLGMQICIP